MIEKISKLAEFSKEDEFLRKSLIKIVKKVQRYNVLCLQSESFYEGRNAFDKIEKGIEYYRTQELRYARETVNLFLFVSTYCKREYKYSLLNTYIDKKSDSEVIKLMNQVALALDELIDECRESVLIDFLGQ